MSATTTTEESVMGQVIPREHPAVVLKSHYKAVRALLVVAAVALAATVVILANNDTGTTVSTAPKSAQVLQPGTRFDGGPDEGTRGIQAAPTAPGTRFDGGPDEGTRGIQTAPTAPGTRFDGGPDEGTRGPQANAQSASPPSSYQAPGEHSSERATPPVIPMGPGGR
jgi:hypothetical protein